MARAGTDTLQAARENLTGRRAPFVELAIDSLEHVGERLGEVEAALAPLFAVASRQALHGALPAAVSALDAYHSWLAARRGSARADTALRALRVEVDVKLALEEFSLAQAADDLGGPERGAGRRADAQPAISAMMRGKIRIYLTL